MLEKAVEDVQLIRNVMDRSTDSLNLLYRLFLWWGIAFAAIEAASGLLCLLWPGLSGVILEAPFLTFIPHLAVVLSASLIFFKFRRDTLDEGLNRQFAALWLIILSFSVIGDSFSVLYAWSTKILQPNPYFIPVISSSGIVLGMFCMYVFTRVKPFGWLALVNLLLILVFCFMLSRFAERIAGMLIYSLFSPLTLLAVGILLRSRLRRKATFTP